MDLRAPRPRSGVLDQPQGQRLESLAGSAPQQAAPPVGGVDRQPPEPDHVGVGRLAEPLAPVAGHGMAGEAQEPHEREEGLARHVPGTEGAVEVEGGKGAGRRRQAEVGLAAVDVDPDEGVEERERARDVPRGTQGLDEPDLGEGRRQGGLADLPRDPRRGLHERPALALLPPAPGRAVLPEAPAQVRGLADVEQGARRVVEAVDAGLRRHAGQEIGAELLVEEAHALILLGGARPREAFSGVGGVETPRAFRPTGSCARSRPSRMPPDAAPSKG